MGRRKKRAGKVGFSPHISRRLSAGVVILLLVINLLPPSAKERAETSRKQGASLAAIAKYASVSDEISQWERILAQNPGYRDGYLVQAINYWQVFDTSQAKTYWQKAFDLDPNYQEVKRVGRALQL